MKFVEIEKEEYQKFWENHPLKTFLSSVEIAELRKKSGYTVSFVGVKENDQLIAATLLTARKKMFGQIEFYAPRGFLIDFKNKELLDFFVNELKSYIKNRKGYVLRVDPYIPLKERDIDGNLVDGGFDNIEIVSNLESLNFKPLDQSDFEQVGWLFALDIENKTEEELLKNMRSNTRNTIKKALKFGIEIKELKEEDLPRFLSIMEETGERKNFSIRNLDYFQNMYRLFSSKGEIKYLVTELNLKKYIEKLKEEIKEKQEKINRLSDSVCNDGRKKSLNGDIEVLENKIKWSEEEIKAKGKDVITLSGSMFVMTQPEVLYLSSGNYKEYLNFNSQYLIQWEMIKYGIKNNFKRYNFYGIPANINTKPKDYGIYEFKKGFDGYVEELIGEYVLPMNGYYKIIETATKMKNKIKK